MGKTKELFEKQREQMAQDFNEYLKECENHEKAMGFIDGYEKALNYID